MFLLPRNMDTPQLVEALKGKVVLDVACGSSHSACTLDDGSMYTWGKGRYGRLGHNDHETQFRPKQVCVCVCGCVWVSVHMCSIDQYVLSLPAPLR